MRRRDRWASSWIVVLMTAGLAAMPAASAVAGSPTPVVWTWPGGCGAATTFQQCIDLANSGDTITIETDGPIDGSIVVSKSLTIVDAPGFDPVFTGSALISADVGTLVVSMGGTAFQGHVEVSLIGGLGHVIELERIRSTGDDIYPAYRVSTHVSASVSLTGGRFTVGGEAEGVDLQALHPSGNVLLSVIGSRISGHDQNGTGGGISLGTAGAGTTWATIKNNVVWDVNEAPAGGSSGIFLGPGGDTTLAADVIGNTVVLARTNAFFLSNDVSGGGSVSLNLFDNVFARSLRGVYLESLDPSTLTGRAGFNGFHRNADENIWEQVSPGPGNIEAHPGFVDLTNGNLRLLADSPFVDAGKVCVPGGPAMIEAGGLSRLAGDTVDIGAHERRADLPTGIVRIGGGGPEIVFGTDGADILCGFGGDDTLQAYEGDDYLDAGGGPDVILAGAGVDHLYGGKGDDPCLLSFDDPRSADLVDGGPGTDGAIFDRLDVLRRVEFEVDGVCG